MVSWVVMLTVWAIVIIEPCHRTERETSRTSILLCKLSLKRTNQAMATETQIFIRSVLMNKVAFAPLGVCELKRSYIIGSILNYWVGTWGGAAKTHLIQLERTQRAVFKTGWSLSYRFPTTDNF
ncbi:hypothetical protein ACJJTC_006021 [Scirpophaga incertulas]